MASLLHICQFLIVFVTVTNALSKNEYLRLRDDVLAKEEDMRLGGDVVLTDAEQRVNATLMHLKAIELDNAAHNISNFPPAVHFFHAKEVIDNSAVFRVIKTMPKGAALHVHDAGIADVHWLIRNATYDPLCYMCTNHTTGRLHFHFFAEPPSDSECEWKQVNKVRYQFGDIDAFDQMLYSKMTMVVDDPRKAYPTAHLAWVYFLSLFEIIFDLILYAPVFRSYVYEVFQEFYDDNVQYMEMRSLFLPAYELDGTTHDTRWVLETYANVAKQFIADHPDFTGAKFILTSLRNVKRADIAASIQLALKLRSEFPDDLAGYDLVGYEDVGHPLIYFIDELLPVAQHKDSLPFFFHAGETDWKDHSVDLNLVDAVLLNTSRIGHGFAAVKHPVVKKLLKEKQIPLEICPVSNQVLMLVDDLRDHPAAALMADNFPMVISSDDPGLWGAVGLSYDFYEAFMGLGGAWADLATLKQLALNSLKYSRLSESEKTTALRLWQKKWDMFIEQSLAEISDY